MKQATTTETNVVCIGDGSNGAGCGPVKGRSGYCCKQCGGMLLSENSLQHAAELAKEWDYEIAQTYQQP